MNDPTMLVIQLIVIFTAIAIHEYAHAKLADSAGDPTPGAYGRVTLNPFKHFDPLGSIFILITVIAGYGIGWGKPVPMDPRKMNNPKWDHFWAVLGGPLSNLLQALVYAIVFLMLRQTGVIANLGEYVIWFLVYGVLINISLMLFNLLPVGPLDGMWIAGTFMPERMRYAWTKWNLTFGQFIFLAMVLIRIPGMGSPISAIIGPVHSFISSRLLGIAI